MSSILALRVSMAAKATDTETKDTTIAKVLQAIQSDRWRAKVQAIRKLYRETLKKTGSIAAAKKAIAPLKKNLPAVMWSGTFSRRVNDALTQHSGLLCADLDSLSGKNGEVRKALLTSPNVAMVLTSPSGDGLKAIFRVPPDSEKHFDSWRAVQKQVFELTGVKIDEKGKDVARLCFVTAQTNVQVNDNAVEIAPLPSEPRPKPQTPQASMADLPLRERIAHDLLGQLEWNAEKGGYFCQCPGKSSHTNSNAPRDTILYLDKVPTLACQHESCLKIVETFNATLRSQIGKAEHAQTQHTAKRENAPSSEQSAANRDNEEIARLAALPLMEYERARKEAANKLNVRATMLDRLVEAHRVLLRPPSESDAQGTKVELKDVELWPEAINGAEILDAIARRFEHYVILPNGAPDTLALWCAHAHIYDRSQISPRLNISAPTQECGKTTLRDCASLFCPRAVRTDNMTTAVMFRLVAGHSPTILADECDKWAFKNEELVGLFNSGHRKGGRVMRCEGDSNELRSFNAYAPVALAAIGSLPSQLHSRSIVIRLERATQTEINSCARFDLDHVEIEHELCRKLARFISDSDKRIAACEPKLPEHLFNRVADNWRPLFQIAAIAGGDWPQRCANALLKLTTHEDEAESLRVMLLADIKQIFGDDLRMFSKDLVSALVELKHQPWPEVCRGGKPMTERWLARNLGAFRIQSRNMRIGQVQAKGYERNDFADAFSRYLLETFQNKRPSVPTDDEKASNASVPTRGKTPPKTSVPKATETAQNASVPNDEVWTDTKKGVFPRKTGMSDAGTDKKRVSPQKKGIQPKSGRGEL